MVYQLIHGKSPTGVRNHLENIDGDFEKVTIADLTPDGGKKISNTQFKAGRALVPDYLPTQVKPQRLFDAPFDDYMPAPKGAAYVSAAFKELVEQFEPGVHQFFEMSLKFDSTEYDPVYYFIVCNRVDALDHAECVPPIGPNDKIYNPTYGPEDKIVFSKEKIGAVHIWSEKHEIGFFMTDQFRDAVFKSGLTGVKDSIRYEEIA